MNIVFYSTTASRFDAASCTRTTLPPRSAMWASIARRYPQHQFFIVTQPPASFLLDGSDVCSAAVPAASADDAAEAAKAATAAAFTVGEGRVRVRLLRDDAPVSAVIQQILAVQPAIAIAASFWLPPYDWLGVQDALVAETLRAHNVRTLCHTASLALDCFDKRRTHALLERLGFAMPKAVYVHHELYWCERRHHELTTNVYKDYVLRELQAMRYPVVIKDTVGLSSYSMEVAVSYRQALSYLNSGRTKVDRLVEEYIAGAQCGVEIYGDDGRYMVLPPLLFSCNRYGITSPKQSVKLGGVYAHGGDARYHSEALQKTLRALAQAVQFSGVAQVDAVFSEAEQKWYIIEINPRLSGMSETYAAALGIPLVELLLRTALSEPLLPASADGALALGTAHAAHTAPAAPSAPSASFPALPHYVCNLKLSLANEAQLASLAAEPCVCYLHQIQNLAARQEREKGYCELVVRAPSLEALMASLDDLAARYDTCMERPFVAQAHALADRLR